MENHHFQWVNPLQMAIFNSYFDITREYTPSIHLDQFHHHRGSCAHAPGRRRDHQFGSGHGGEVPGCFFPDFGMLKKWSNGDFPRFWRSLKYFEIDYNDWDWGDSLQFLGCYYDSYWDQKREREKNIAIYTGVQWVITANLAFFHHAALSGPGLDTQRCWSLFHSEPGAI